MKFVPVKRPPWAPDVSNLLFAPVITFLVSGVMNPPPPNTPPYPPAQFTCRVAASMYGRGGLSPKRWMIAARMMSLSEWVRKVRPSKA